MSQQFSNSIDTTLAALLSDVATTATLTDATGLSTPTGTAFELLTLWDVQGNVEIVRMTARSGNTITITRAQEGTTARSWVAGSRIFTGVTAGTLATFLVNRATGTNSLAVGPSAQAAGNTASAFGVNSNATSADSIAIGRNSYVAGLGGTSIGTGGGGYTDGHVGLGLRAIPGGAGSIAIGADAFTAANGGEIAIGRNAWSGGDDGVVIGDDSYIDYSADNCTVIGANSFADWAQSVVIVGNGTSAGSGANGAIALGTTLVETARTCQIAALPAVSKNNRSYTQANAAWMMAASASVIMSEPLDLKTLQTHTIPIPTGVTFFPEEVGVIITAAAGVTGQPTLRFGITGTEAKFLAATATTGLDAVHERERFTTLASSDGAKTLRAEVTVAATGTTLTGRVYWRGYAVVDS